MQVKRIGMVGLVLAMGLGLGSARAGTETFDNTGLSSTWVLAGSFTGQEGVVWTYANARGTPTVYTNNPSISLQSTSTNSKGWLLSGNLTGGCSRVSAAVKQTLSLAVDFDLRVNGQWIANYKSTGGVGAVEMMSFDAFDRTSRIPFTNDFTLMISNRLAGSGTVALDDLSWEPFRLFVRLPQTNTVTAYVGSEFELEATVFDVGQEVSGQWSISPAFEGQMFNENTTRLMLIPVSSDVGKNFTLTYMATDAVGGGYTNQASCPLTVQEGPRWVDFEEASFGYNTNSGGVVDLKGMNWVFFNVRTSDSTDRRIGAASARFRHLTGLAASMESQDPFSGIGTVSIHYAYYGTTNRVVTFAVQVHGEGQEWSTVSNGTFNVQGHDDITNSVFSVDVSRHDDVWIRLITTGNAGELANIDNVRIRPFGDTLPRLVWSGETNAPVGRTSVLDFSLLNAEGIVREWTSSIDPENVHAVLEETADKNLRLTVSPVDTNEWGVYMVNVSASMGGQTVGATSVAIRVVSPPSFVLAPMATNIAVPGIVDVWVTNVVLHNSGSDWTTVWLAEPMFSNGHSVSNKSRFRILAGTTPADVGVHTLTALLTDSGTGVRVTNVVVLTVTGSGGGGDITNEVYEILPASTVTNLMVNGRTGRVFQVVGKTNLISTNWSWLGAAVTNTDGAAVILELPVLSNAPSLYYGVRVRAAP